MTDHPPKTGYKSCKTHGSVALRLSSLLRVEAAFLKTYRNAGMKEQNGWVGGQGATGSAGKSSSIRYLSKAPETV